MDDNVIVEMYWQRSEKAVEAVAEKYGKYCKSIAAGILKSEEDTQECVNDTYVRLWNAIPPASPQNLKAFIARTVRNIAVNMCEKMNAEKRGGGVYSVALEELEECIPSAENTENAADAEFLSQLLDDFLEKMKPEARSIFVRRYWCFNSIGEIADSFGVSESKVKMSLLRSRKSLKDFLEKEGVIL